MPYINSTNFGSVTVDHKKYFQVLIIGDETKEREYEKLKELFNTSHEIGDWEINELLENNPEIIVVGTGQDGCLNVGEALPKKAKKNNIKVISEITPTAIQIYNEKAKAGHRVNALIHTTC